MVEMLRHECFRGNNMLALCLPVNVVWAFALPDAAHRIHAVAGLTMNFVEVGVDAFNSAV